MQPSNVHTIYVNGTWAADKLMFLILSVVFTAVTVCGVCLSEIIRTIKRILHQHLYGLGWRTLGSQALASKKTTQALRWNIPLLRDKLGYFPEPQLGRRGADPRTLWFRQFGATSLKAWASMNVLTRNAATTRYFSERWRSLGCTFTEFIRVCLLYMGVPYKYSVYQKKRWAEYWELE